MRIPLLDQLGLLASIALPIFNIPLMLRLIQRKSSDDLSLAWVLGVFFCLLFMLPAGLRSVDEVFRVFSILNLIMFSGVTYLALYYRMKKR
ncbi:MAG: hypothetical protein HQM15_01510 [Deltaproteobacteria bacterium]|nr:hypothetical protein [Deltaproteobacteria bacterium]